MCERERERKREGKREIPLLSLKGKDGRGGGNESWQTKHIMTALYKRGRGIL